MNTVTVPANTLGWSLLALRVSVTLVLAMWVLNKFLNVERTAGVFKVFYGIEGVTSVASYTLGALQAAVVIAFLIGFKKRWSTAIVFVIHLASTVTSFDRYLSPWAGSNLLFFAAWPMLAAILALYLLRDYDTRLSIDKGASG